MQLKENVSLVQKTALFYTAAELSRRGFNVNILDDDMLFAAKDDKKFYIKVSGQGFKKSWIVEKREDIDNIVYVFVYIPRDIYDRPEFFILTKKELEKEIKNKKLKSPKDFLSDKVLSLTFSSIVKYADKWISIN